MSIVLTFDLGTTMFKASLFDSAGKLLALGRMATPIDQPHAGWRQIEADRFKSTLCRLAEQLRAQDAAAYARVAAISFATQTNSMLLLDEHDQPLTPVILWNDARAGDFQDEISTYHTESDFQQQTGVPALNTHFALAKLLWLKRHEPGLWRRARRCRLIGDQLAWWLTGRHVTEAGAAGLTGLLDIHTLRWREHAVAKAGLSHLALPTPMRAGSDLGAMDRELAKALQLPVSCRVVLGCLDQYAGAIGAGNVEPGGLSETTGTVLATVSLATTFDASAGAGVVQGPTWQPGLWWRMCFGSVSANLFEALRRGEADDPSFEALAAEAAEVPRGAEGLLVDRGASEAAGEPVYVGLRPAHTRGHRVRAVFEAVAEALRGQVASLSLAGRPGEIRSVGGAARSGLWLQIKADALQLPVVAIDTPEPTSLGAATLALAALTRRPLAEVAGRVTRAKPARTPSADAVS